MSKLSVPKLKRKEFLSVRTDKTGYYKRNTLLGIILKGLYCLKINTVRVMEPSCVERTMSI